MATSDYMPWSWTLISSTGSCPSPSRVLGTYAVTATIITTITLIAGHRKVVQYVTCQYWGSKESRSWRWTWIFPLIVSLCAAGINAAIIERDPSRDNNYPLPQIFLLQLTLPRMSFFCLLLVLWAQWLNKQENEKENPIAHLKHGASAAAALIAEMVIQIPIMYFLGNIVYFAFHHGYYIGNSKWSSVPKGAKMMYVAAVYHLAASGIAIVVLITVGTYSTTTKSEHDRLTALILWCLVLGVLTFAADWVFWAGFLKLAGDTYCVPRIELQSLIRILFSALGALLGGGWA